MLGVNLYTLSYKLKRLYSINHRDGKIDYTPALCGRYFMFDSLHDYLVEEGHEIKIKGNEHEDDIEAKKILWAICKDNAKLEKAYTKEYAIRLYKSELIYLWLVQKYNLEGLKLDIKGADGKNVPVLTWNKEYENSVKGYLEQKTINLMV